VLVPVSQRPEISQHPPGQVDALQGIGWQNPAPHISPGGHASQARPPEPQAPGVRPSSQNPNASQQPLGQVEASQVVPLHTPPEHESPGGHGRHAAPPKPQAEVLSPGSHLPKLSQQPDGHVVGLHVTPSHPPAMQVSPGGQVRHAPPPLPQALVLRPGRQIPAASQQPVGQVISLQGWATQAPLMQMSLGGHIWQATPPVPQAEGMVPS
jgi:hypothetical protein